MSFEKLPADIIKTICKFTLFQNLNAPKDLLNFRSVCKQFKNILTPEELIKLTDEMYILPGVSLLEKIYSFSANNLKSTIVSKALQKLNDVLQVADSYGYSHTQMNMYNQELKKWSEIAQSLIIEKETSENDGLYASECKFKK